MPASGQLRRLGSRRLARTLAGAGTGAAVAALPLFGASHAPAATPAAAPAAAPAATGYPADLAGWVRASLSVLAQHGSPGPDEAIPRNITRESSGNPQAINLWGSNAAKGTPSKGLLQVIDPTFAAYRVPGTVYDPYDPVANITAACNYAA